MKKFRLFSFLLILLPAMAMFTACDKNNEEEMPELPTTPFDPTVVAGVYAGKMGASVTAMGTTYEGLDVSGDYQVSINDIDTVAGTATVVLPKCSYTPPMATGAETIPSLTISGVGVKDTGDGFASLEIKDYLIVMNRVQYTVSIIGYDKASKEGTTIDGNDINLVYTVAPGRMPGYITFNFTGKALYAPERK